MTDGDFAEFVTLPRRGALEREHAWEVARSYANDAHGWRLGVGVDPSLERARVESALRADFQQRFGQSAEVVIEDDAVRTISERFYGGACAQDFNGYKTVSTSRLQLALLKDRFQHRVVLGVDDIIDASELHQRAVLVEEDLDDRRSLRALRGLRIVGRHPHVERA